MNPQYRHYINDVEVFPYYQGDLSKDIEQEADNMFFRGKLSGGITLVGADFELIWSADFETVFSYRMSMKLEDGTWDENYQLGTFNKADCTFDLDDRRLTVNIAIYDAYNDVLGGLDKEFNMLSLGIEQTHLTAFRRSIVQLYMLGTETLTNVLNGTYWEQPCKAVTSVNDVENKYHFYRGGTPINVVVNNNGASPNVGGTYETFDNFTFRRTDGLYTMRSEKEVGKENYLTYIVDTSGRDLFVSSRTGVEWPAEGRNFTPVKGIGYPRGNRGENGPAIYIRMLTDRSALPKSSSSSNYPSVYRIGNDDIQTNINPNYRYVTPYAVGTERILFHGDTTKEPTEWGVAPNGNYYVQPYKSGQLYFPVGRSSWADASIWFAPDYASNLTETKAQMPYTTKDSYLLHGVITALLKEFAPNITHEPTAEYSEFLYGKVSLRPIDGTQLIITPKSNVLNSVYENPANNAPITLREIFTMLRECYQCFWFIENNKLRIEHIQYFKNGGRYTSYPPLLGTDLTTRLNPSNDKPYSFGLNKLEFDKADLPEQMQFKYMDDTSLGYSGFPIKVLSNYVTQGKVDERNAGKFTPDIDFMLGAPENFSKDGFALFEAGTPNWLDLGRIFYGYIRTDGVLINTNESSGWAYQRSPCVPGQSYRLMDYYGRQLDGVYWHFWNIRGDSIGRADTTDGLVVVPSNAYELTFSFRFIKPSNPNDDLPVYMINYSDVIRPINWELPIVDLLNYQHQPYDFRINYAKGRKVLYGSRIYISLQDNNINHTPNTSNIAWWDIYTPTNAISYQNGYLSWIYLHPTFHKYNLPARNVEINDEPFFNVIGIERRRKQTVKFTEMIDPDPLYLIKTGIGNGQVEKLSVNLSSRVVEATLKYDTDDDFKQ